MNVKGLISAALIGLLTALPAYPQGFAGLGTSAEGFALPDPDRALIFPQDHGAHPDFRIEWWYLTTNLKGADGRDYGAQWTLFRSALAPEAAAATAPGWQSRQVWFAHAAVTTPDTHLYSEKFARGGTGQAGVTAAPFSAWLDDWAMRAPANTDGIAQLDLSARGDGFSYALTLDAGDRPLVLHGDKGFSVKSALGQASHYFSQPAYAVTGTLTVDGQDIPVTGSAWLDREWSSQPLSDDQDGWDWFALSFESGEKAMLARVRTTAPNATPFVFGTWIAADGSAAQIAPDGITLTPTQDTEVAGRILPTRWRIDIPSRGVAITTTPVNPDAWMGTMFPYWEGPIRISGSHSGQGYLEMTGY